MDIPIPAAWKKLSASSPRHPKAALQHQPACAVWVILNDHVCGEWEGDLVVETCGVCRRAAPGGAGRATRRVLAGARAGRDALTHVHARVVYTPGREEVREKNDKDDQFW